MAKILDAVWRVPFKARSSPYFSKFLLNPISDS
jgi:hypothetical protein